jgi:hypothetical protein
MHLRSQKEIKYCYYELYYNVAKEKAFEVVTFLSSKMNGQ